MTSSSVEAVMGIMRSAAILNSGATLSAQMVALCRQTTELLGCDRSSIFLWNGEAYQGTYNWGNPPEIEKYFYDFTLRVNVPIVQRAEASSSHVVINDARNEPLSARLAEVANIHSMVIAPLVEADGSRLGLMTAEFNERMGEFDSTNALVTRAAAHIAHAAVLQDREVSLRLELSQAMVEIEDSARRRIGRDIHDDALQRTLALTIRTETLLRQLTDPWLRSEIGALLADARAAAQVLRQVTTHLHPASLGAVSLDALCHDLLGTVAKQHGCDVELEDTRTEAISVDAERVLGRILQQAVQNAGLHSGASSVRVKLSSHAGGTAASVIDDGVGFEPTQVNPGRLGLVSMRERATLMDGTFVIDSQPGSGCTIHAWIPHQKREVSEHA